jgi:hypothetical protein
MEMVELDVEARQGDSGGPIFNQQGELAGVLFGAGHGTTLGSYAPRVSNFLATLAPDIGQAKDQALVAVADRPAPNVENRNSDYRDGGVSKYPSVAWSPLQDSMNESWVNDSSRPCAQLTTAPTGATATGNHPQQADDIGAGNWYEALKSALAVVGLAAIAAQLVKIVR